MISFYRADQQCNNAERFPTCSFDSLTDGYWLDRCWQWHPLHWIYWVLDGPTKIQSMHTQPKYFIKAELYLRCGEWGSCIRHSHEVAQGLPGYTPLPRCRGRMAARWPSQLRVPLRSILLFPWEQGFKEKWGACAQCRLMSYLWGGVQFSFRASGAKGASYSSASRLGQWCIRRLKTQETGLTMEALETCSTGGDQIAR